jgi:hypothetical protein
MSPGVCVLNGPWANVDETDSAMIARTGTHLRNLRESFIVMPQFPVGEKVRESPVIVAGAKNCC